MIRGGRPASRRRRVPVAALAGGSAIATFLLVTRYRRDLRAARSRLARVDRRLVATDWGAVEYAERGVGEPLPVLHGIFGGCDGVLFDAFVSNADVNTCELEAIRVPTLVAHTKDDPFASHEAGRRAAGRIPGARFVSLESGGHLMLGQTTIIHDELAEFFAENNRLR